MVKQRDDVFSDAIAKSQKMIFAKSLTASIDTTSIDSMVCLGNIDNAIDELILRHDHSLGISSTYLQDTRSQPILMRDARNITDNQDYLYYPYAVMGLNAFRAARKLCECAGVSKQEIDLRFPYQLAGTFYKAIRLNAGAHNAEYDLALFIERTLLPELAAGLNINDEEAAKRLNVAKEFCNFEHSPLTVATLTQHSYQQQRIDILHVDVPIYKLTTSQISIYKNRAHQTWYTKQPEWLRQLIDHYARRIIAGRVIPTQLIKFIPGLRNAGEEKIFAFLADGNVEEIYHGYHSGNIGHLSKGDNYLLTGMSVEQLLEEIPSSRLHLNALTSPMKVMSERERRLFLQVEKAANDRRQHVSFGNTPVNILRPVAGLEIKSTDWIFYDLEKLLKHVLISDVYKAHEQGDAFWAGLQDYFTQNDIKDSLFALRPEYRSHYHFIALLRLALKFKLTKKSNDAACDGNRNLELASLLKLIAYHCERCCAILKSKQFEPIAVIDFCKSGKDREGLLRILTLSAAIANYLSGYSIEHSDIYSATEKMIIRAQHVQRQAGLYGCTLGAEGFVPSAKYTLPSHIVSYKNQLLLRTARFNKHYPSLQHRHPAADQRQYMLKCFFKAVNALAYESNHQQDTLDLMKLSASTLAMTMKQAYLTGNISSENLPVVTDLLISSKKVIDQYAKDGAVDAVNINKYLRIHREIVNNRELKNIALATACIFFGAVMLATAVTLAIICPITAPIATVTVVAGIILIKAAITSAAVVGAGSIMAGGLFAALSKKDINAQVERESWNFYKLSAAQQKT